MKKKPLNGCLVFLRELEESFFTDYLAAFSPRIRKLLNVKHTSSELHYLRQRLERQREGETIFFCIFDKGTKKLIGALEIRGQEETTSQLYSWMNERFWSTGRYQEALRLAAQEYFRRTNEKNLYAHVDATNKRSYFALKKNGFADIGTYSGPHGRQYQLILRKK